MRRQLPVFVYAALVLCAASRLPAAGRAVDPDFKPELVAAELTAEAVRPGDPFALTLKFRNAGTKPARGDYMLFVHFEAPRKDCRTIVIHADHAPADPTSLWRPGQIVLDGPRVLTAPADQPEQEYFIHVGVYDQGGPGGRLLDVYAPKKLRVSRAAPSPEEMGPPKLPPAEVARRRAAIAARIATGAGASLETKTWRMDLDRATGAWAIVDKATGVRWTSDPARPRFGEVLLRNGQQSAIWRIDRFDEVVARPGRLQMTSRPRVEGQPSGTSVVFTVEPMNRPDGLRLAYATEAHGPWQVARVRLLDNAFTVTEADEGRVYVPQRLGIERVACKAFPGSETWRTYTAFPWPCAAR